MGSVLLIGCVVYLGLCLGLYFLQERLVFLPSRTVVKTPQAAGLVYENVFLRAGDARIHAWYVPAKNARLSVLFCHGNAGNISHRLETLSLLNSLGVNVLIFDYSGFGLSNGKASEVQTYRDVEAAWRFLIEDKVTDPASIVLFGRSLGGAVATWIAAKEKPGALILESTFISIIAMGKKLYPIIPVRLLARVRYDSSELIEKVKSPKLFIHSPDDEIIPFKHGVTLYNKAKEPKTFVEIRGNHNSGFLDSGRNYTVPLQSFLRKVEQSLAP
ncbi:MAG: alpha/beta hydrolase [Pseudomonadota bacterium]|nr:alpha/beta hydrolase [Pseudomonadota bacterium]